MVILLKLWKNLNYFITSNLRWHKNTKYITTKGFQRLWMPRRIKQLGASQSEFITVYVKQVRSTLDVASALWSPGLTQDYIVQIEFVQKSAFEIILEKKYISYENSPNILNLKTLTSRREELFVNFAKNAAYHQRHNTWFEPQTDTKNTRSEKIPKMPVNFRTDRFNNSPLPYLTSLLNKLNQ